MPLRGFCYIKFSTKLKPSVDYAFFLVSLSKMDQFGKETERVAGTIKT